MQRAFRLLCVMITLPLAAACAGDPKDRAGTWQGTSKYGDFTFTIDETGTKILYIKYDLRNESVKMTSEYDLLRAGPVEMKGGKFSLAISLFANVPGVEWEGSFNASGTKAQGTLWLLGASKEAARWTATKAR